MNVESILRKTEIFSQLSGEQIERLSRVAAIKEFPAGTRVIRRGDRGVALYAVIKGRVRVLVPPYKDAASTKETCLKDTSEWFMVNELGAGDVFGEMSLLDGAPRTSDVITLEPTDCVVLSRFDFSTEMDRDPDIARAVIPYLCSTIRRLREDVRRFKQVVGR